MAFEKVSASNRASDTAKISIRKSNSIGINNAALDEFFSEDHEEILVLYDEEDNLLALNPLEEGTEDSYAMSRTGGGGTVTPSSFMKGKGLVPEVTTQYEPQAMEVDGEDVVVIDLDEPIATYGSPYEDEAEEEEAAAVAE